MLFFWFLGLVLAACFGFWLFMRGVRQREAQLRGEWEEETTFETGVFTPLSPKRRMVRRSSPPLAPDARRGDDTPSAFAFVDSSPAITAPAADFTGGGGDFGGGGASGGWGDSGSCGDSGGDGGGGDCGGGSSD